MDTDCGGFESACAECKSPPSSSISPDVTVLTVLIIVAGGKVLTDNSLFVMHVYELSAINRRQMSPLPNNRTLMVSFIFYCFISLFYTFGGHALAFLASST